MSGVDGFLGFSRTQLRYGAEDFTRGGIVDRDGPARICPHPVTVDIASLAEQIRIFELWGCGDRLIGHGRLLGMDCAYPHKIPARRGSPPVEDRSFLVGPAADQSVCCSAFSTWVSASGRLCVMLKSLTFLSTTDGTSGL